jgi:hypothetical protein
LLAAAALVGSVSAGAGAAPPTPPPGAQISASLEYVGRVPNSGLVGEGKFDTVAGREVLVTTGRFGFRTYDVTNPESPQLLDTFQPPDILGANGYWQDEDMDLDVRRNLIIGALDARHTDVDQSRCPGTGSSRDPGCRSGFYVISYADPANLVQVGKFVGLPSGHTASCIDDCRYVWTGGPSRRDDQRSLGPYTLGGRGDGRPIWVTDLRNPARPKTFSKPIDLWRNDGATDYSHDVDVDARGIAWVSGRGGLRGWDTRHRLRDPFTGKKRVATPWNPILVAGGGVAGGTNGVAQPQTDFIHNSARPLNGKVHASGVADANIVLMTEEDFTEPCDQGGRIVAADITNSLGGKRTVKSTPAHPYRLTPLGAFSPTRVPETAAPISACSAHYFEVSGSMLAAGWYGQGLRVIDASDARNLRQVGYYYVTGTDPATNPSSLSWDTAWHGDLIYLFDMSRGIEILRLAGGAAASPRLPTVQDPPVQSDPLAARPARGALFCPAFVVPR